ncbi:benzil reductase ((S)-benzoin forming) [Desulfosarcina widdelii]|uniref:Benzil reductase ((S)-benzoin forming) n=1 Tax=Desulfosarcina widdelii TaxID=947919 RepID=A0A5K7ZCJ8_9BACT|nr:SDR family NAD(P)-dependent oxidoreductase [Desulfosarcina widdelii]BBO78848.1 benzil reductase ((S)-benzoin forming) [Desulfosarcina widdelii]
MDSPSVEHLFIITGTTRGIGRALADQALALGDSFVVGFSRVDVFLEGNYQNIHVDLNAIETIGAAFDAIGLDSEIAGGLKKTVLINNAGVLDPIAPIIDCDTEALAGNIRVNLTAPMLLAHHFYRFSKAFPGKKCIVNITSGASKSPYFGWSAYGAAKAGLDMATRSMALEFSRIDPAFHVCAVAPGTVDTDMQAQIRKCTPEQFERVDKFMDLKANSALSTPRQTAVDLVRLIVEGRLENGGRYDLREMKG